MPLEFYEELFLTLSPHLKECKETTIEANPDSFCKDMFATLKELGVNRVSFGIQSFNNDKLKKLGRTHSVEKAKSALKDTKEIGFKNISIDFIYGVEGDTARSLKQEIKNAISLDTEHISAYSLSIEEGTPFAKKPEVAIKNNELGMCVKEALEEEGFVQYEVSNFGKIESKHNLNYWKQGEYLGIGCGAVGFVDNKRIYTNKYLQEYLKNPMHRHIEYLNTDELRFERLFLGLRSRVGVDISDIKNRKNLALLIAEDKIRQERNRVYCNDFFLADEIVLFLE